MDFQILLHPFLAVTFSVKFFTEQHLLTAHTLLTNYFLDKVIRIFWSDTYYCRFFFLGTLFLWIVTPLHICPDRPTFKQGWIVLWEHFTIKNVFWLCTVPFWVFLPYEIVEIVPCPLTSLQPATSLHWNLLSCHSDILIYQETKGGEGFICESIFNVTN